jgi:hypothetical protein
MTQELGRTTAWCALKGIVCSRVHVQPWLSPERHGADAQGSWVPAGPSRRPPQHGKPAASCTPGAGQGRGTAAGNAAPQHAPASEER